MLKLSTKRKIILKTLLALFIACGLFFLVRCQYTSKVQPVTAVQIALDWNRFILDAEVNTEGYRGPVAARTYAHIGLAAYEAALPGLAGYQSLATTLQGIELPEIPEAKNYQVEAALHASYCTIMEYFFMSSPETIKQKWQHLKDKWNQELRLEMDSVTFITSSEYGSAVARAVYEWSGTDSLGYNANHHNYDRNYQAPVGDGLWVPSAHFPMPALLPYWGGVKSFVIDPDEFMAKPLPPYSSEPSQFYHTHAMELVTLSNPLSAENKWISDFWNDDRPGLTFTPAGHWLAITNQVIEKERPTIEKALESYLRVGIALSDAIVACWKAKYHYNVERPETFIKKHISKSWRPYSPTPSFPSYPSGHSMMGAAAAKVLTSMYGEGYKMEDHSHRELSEFSTIARKFNSFEEMANENALSRMLMGVHYRFDCEEGLRLGDLIGKEIVAVQLEKKLTQ